MAGPGVLGEGRRVAVVPAPARRSAAPVIGDASRTGDRPVVLELLGDHPEAEALVQVEGMVDVLGVDPEGRPGRAGVADRPEASCEERPGEPAPPVRLADGDRLGPAGPGAVRLRRIEVVEDVPATSLAVERDLPQLGLERRRLQEAGELLVAAVLGRLAPVLGERLASRRPRRGGRARRPTGSTGRTSNPSGSGQVGDARRSRAGSARRSGGRARKPARLEERPARRRRGRRRTRTRPPAGRRAEPPASSADRRRLPGEERGPDPAAARVRMDHADALEGAAAVVPVGPVDAAVRRPARRRAPPRRSRGPGRSSAGGRSPRRAPRRSRSRARRSRVARRC